MFKKGLALVTLLSVMMPIMAYSWTLTTRVNSSLTGGTLTVRGVDQATYTAFKNYTTTSDVPVAVTAATGFRISNVVLNGVVQAVPANTTSLSYTMGLDGYPTKIKQSVGVWFAKKRIAVTATAGAGGSVYPAGTVNVQYGKLKGYLFTPFKTNRVLSINIDGTDYTAPPAGYAFRNALDTADVTLPAALGARVKVKFTVGLNAITLSGKFQDVSVSAGAPQTVAPNTLVTLTATGSGALGAYAWTQVGGAPVTLAGAATATATFTPTATGKYTFKVTNGVAYAYTTVTVASTPQEIVQVACGTCHKALTPTVYNNWSTSAHKTVGVLCYNCHTGADTGAHPGTVSAATCTPCHNNGATLPVGNPHTAAGPANCIGCHAIGQNAGPGYVQDNNGVRAITGEFTKWSHHVTGVTLQNQHCAVCHLEGKLENGSIVTDPAYHMADATTHLRNVDTDADMTWDPAAPSHSTMDNFCMSCHDNDGATSAQVAAIMATATPAAGKTFSATNPFADTISNQYDMLERPAVVDAKGQFNTGNNSHHAVLGKKYTGRTRVAGSRQIADPVAFTSNSSATLPGKRSTIYDAGKFEAAYTTLGDATGETGARNGGSDLGDDSTLHCGDCHTVGQFRAADAAPGNRYNKAVIGAHGSANEYMLRNNVGTDARHQGAETEIAGGNYGVGYGVKPYLVCFNCHAFNTYGTVGANNGETGKNHAGEYSKDERCNGPFNTVFGNMTGEHRLRSMSTVTGLPTATPYPAAAYGQWVGSGKYFGNMFGIQCANCHSSGVKGNIFGGIHGSGTDQTYVDGMGNTSKHIRFMPGLGNAMFVPGVKGGIAGGSPAVYKAYSGNRNGTGTGNTSGQTFSQLPVRTIRVTGVDNANGSYEYITGGVSNDLNWEQRTQQSIAGQTDLQSKAMGCYTITPPAPNYTWATDGSRVIGSAPTGQQKNPKVLFLAVNGYPADDVRNAASTGLTAGDGREMFDVWGGCDDHNGAAGAGTGIVRKVLRKVSY